jgi:hypothetical protein
MCWRGLCAVSGNGKNAALSVNRAITFRRALNLAAVHFDQTTGKKRPESGSLCASWGKLRDAFLRRHNCDIASWALPPGNQIEANLLVDLAADDIGEFR